MRYGNPLKKSKTVVSLRGHAIEFPGRLTALKDGSFPDGPPGSLIDAEGIIYVYVPPIMREEVAAAGMQPETDAPEPVERKTPAKPDDPEALRKAAFETFEILVVDADRESFAGTGVPKAAAVEKLLGYSLTGAELKDLWAKFLLEAKDRK